jgi:hypothetical protein
MADQKNQNQGTQDSQSGRTPQGKQSSQQPTSENLKNRDKTRERDEERAGSLSDADRRKGAMDTRSEETDNLEGRTRTSATGSERRDDDEDELNDDTRRQDRL